MSRPTLFLRHAFVAALFAITASAAQAQEVVAAVAANFAAAMTRIEPAFEQVSGHQLTVVLGSSGKFVAQIQQGAPFDVLLSADAERPALLAQSGLGVPASRFTYAIGQLALWSPDPDRFGADGATYLRTGGFRHLVIANPAVAPYGAAAQQTLEKLGLWSVVQDKIVRGEDIGQAYAMTASGAAEAGFVALSQVLAGGKPGSTWQVPQELYPPLYPAQIAETKVSQVNEYARKHQHPLMSSMEEA